MKAKCKTIPALELIGWIKKIKKNGTGRSCFTILNIGMKVPDRNKNCNRKRDNM